jgi:ABC-type transporter Mla subunit MlaD
VLSRLIAGFRARSDALAEMPFGLLRMNESMREMTDAVVSTTDTLDHVQRLVLRVDRLVGDLEEPLRSLAPGLTRLAKVLDDPTVDTLPETLHRLSQDALPLVKGMRDTQARMAVIAASTDRITSIVDETGNRIAGLAGLVPGAGGLLRGRRSPPSQAATALADGAVEDVRPPEPGGDGPSQPADLVAADGTVSLRSSA